MKYSIDVTINVTDVDEPNFAPVFTEGTSTTRSVAENPASGQNIGAAVTATDANMSDTLTYTLGGMDAADFGIVPSSGQLQTSAALVFETKDSYAVTVSVSDGNGGADSIDVTINVTADRAALVALYNATGGANWTNDTNWLSNEALSEWHKVETDEDGRVTALRLVANELSGELPAELANLTNLQVLSLSINTLSGRVPAALGNLTNLEDLYLSQNILSGRILHFERGWQRSISRGPSAPLHHHHHHLQTVSDAPTNLLAVGGDGQVVLIWEAPERRNRSALERSKKLWNVQGVEQVLESVNLTVPFEDLHIQQRIPGLSVKTIHVVTVSSPVKWTNQSRVSSMIDGIFVLQIRYEETCPHICRRRAHPRSIGSLRLSDVTSCRTNTLPRQQCHA